MNGRMPQRRRAEVFRLALLALLMAGLAGAGALAAQQAPPAASSAVLRVTTRLVLVDVVVTDKNGQPVAGLTRDDFALLDNGKPQRVGVFSFEQPATRAAQTPAPTLPPHVYSNRAEFHAPDGPPTILLLDLVNTALRDQVYAREQLTQYLATQLKTNQRYAILALGKQLVLLQDFTADPARLRAAIEKYNPQKSIELSRGEPFQLPPDIAASLPAAVLEAIERSNVLRLADATDDRVRITLNALQALARAVAGYPGRKNLVWVSSAFPFTVFPSNPSLLYLTRNYEAEMRRTANALADAQVAIYPVDARGLVGVPDDRAYDANVTSPIGRRGEPIGEDELTRRLPLVVDTQQTMEEIARETGGRAFYNRNDLDTAVARSVEDGSTYYTLGFYPAAENWDGKWHRLEVNLARRGLQARYRRGYYATSRMSAEGKTEGPIGRSEQDVLELLSDPLPATGIRFYALVPPPEPANPMQVDARFRLEAHEVPYESTEDGKRRLTLEFLVAAVSQRGVILTTGGRTFRAELEPEEFQRLEKEGLVLQVPLTLVPGDYARLRLLVRDPVTGLAGAVDVPMSLTVPETPANP